MGGDGGVFFLDAGRVGEHDGDEIARGRRAVDRSLITLAHQVGQVAAVIDVGVTEYHGVERRWIEGKMFVARAGFLARTAMQSAVKQDLLLGGLDEVHRAGDGLGRPKKSNMRPIRAC